MASGAARSPAAAVTPARPISRSSTCRRCWRRFSRPPPLAGGSAAASARAEAMTDQDRRTARPPTPRYRTQRSIQQSRPVDSPEAENWDAIRLPGLLRRDRHLLGPRLRVRPSTTGGPSSLASSQIAVVARSLANVLYLLAGQRRLLAHLGPSRMSVLPPLPGAQRTSSVVIHGARMYEYTA